MNKHIPLVSLNGPFENILIYLSTWNQFETDLCVCQPDSKKYPEVYFGTDKNFWMKNATWNFALTQPFFLSFFLSFSLSFFIGEVNRSIFFCSVQYFFTCTNGRTSKWNKESIIVTGSNNSEWNRIIFSVLQLLQSLFAINS